MKEERRNESKGEKTNKVAYQPTLPRKTNKLDISHLPSKVYI